ncbi:MAG TPA: type IV toxin-antitoxin system AbiEi family antitoxin domain-containing protein [Acidimicrobiales bacterium]|jgi:predicted transcriptional regulator of viral defense system/very-short-patch-repair endonuclease|nr:type IV toxin-antitoxin system AbiEi family antitoxin domain-containing protein [Acidimicrobiales bacterium]
MLAGMGPDDRLYRIAGRQLGLVTAAQLHGVGLSVDQVWTRMQRGQLRRVRRGVYRLAGTPVTWERSVLAAVLASSSTAVASHITAGALWSPSVIPRANGMIHLTSPCQGRLAGVQVHRRELPHWQRTEWEGVPVTRPERTIIDVAGAVGVDVLARCTDDLIRRRLLDLERLRDLARRFNRGPRAAALGSVLADRLPGYRAHDSDWEERMDALYDSLPLPAAARQYEISTPRGTYRVDRAIVELRIAIEWNGYSWHGQRSSFDDDSDREADLASVGWQLLAFTAKTSPERLCAAVLGAVRGSAQAGYVDPLA